MGEEKKVEASRLGEAGGCGELELITSVNAGNSTVVYSEETIQVFISEKILHDLSYCSKLYIYRL